MTFAFQTDWVTHSDLKFIISFWNCKSEPRPYFSCVWSMYIVSMFVFIFEKSRYCFRRLKHKKMTWIARNCGSFHTWKMLKIHVKIISNFTIYIYFYKLTVSQSGYFPNEILDDRSVLYWVIGLKQFQFFCMCKCFFVS